MIPEIRDYQRINAELVGLLDAGHSRIFLDGAEGQRLLAAGLGGDWRATIEIDGPTGPELAASLDAPDLTIVARGRTADGAGRGLAAGRVVVLGDATDGVGFGQSGGTLIVLGSAGHRSGLAQSGGTLAIFGRVGRLAGDRQSGGRLFVAGSPRGPFRGRGRSGGRLIDVAEDESVPEADRADWLRVLELASAWVDVRRFRGR